ncbi:P-selectin-like [Amblyraja radiata]|uniref:P-selectin-like n=1 Tax=Amblyraja radiata TaxID=386614 RepID=UPI001403432C|nr:P-selectin-like [Amblyraja radiata]
MFRLLTLTVVIYEILLFGGMQGWVYHHHDITMVWENARNYCKEHYTDMVAIQNMEENKYLMEYLPKGYAQVWIGLRMINNSWTWIGTNRKLENVFMNWAPGEPSNGKNNEDCVGMYIQAAAVSGKWSDEPCMNMKRPLCFQASCTPDSCNGHGECVETIGAFTCACNEGFYGVRCEQVLKCLRLEARDPVIMNCSHPYKNFSYNSTCDFSCAEGFQLHGERRVQCTASAEWTKHIPECKAVSCKRLVFSRKDHMNCFHPHGSFRYNTTCTFGCREGYALKGPESIQCLASGQWTDRLARCTVQQCETLVIPEHGNMSCIHPIAEFKYNSACDFSCSEGFALNGPSRLQCKDLEQWSAQNPTCEAVKCSELTAPPNLIMDCSDPFRPFSYSSICDFSCKDGFNLQGSDRLQCDVSGQWTSKIPICKAVQCMPLNIPHRGNMNCQHMYGNNSYNATCVFSCTEGFVLHGSNELQCQSSKQWTAEVPSCEATNCTTLVNPEQGTVNCSHPFGLFRYNATCDVICEKGFIVNGSGTVQCGASGQWTPQIPSCKAMKCDMLRSPERGSYNCTHPIDYFSYNSSCDFSCAEGFTLMGSDRLECRTSGQWTAPPPTCSVITCQTITQPEQGMINCTHPIGNFSYSSTCGFGCAKGFVLQGSDVLKCESSGQWTADTPSCKAVTCQTLTHTTKGAMNCSHPFGNFSYSSTCDFSCMEGFALNGSERLQCQDNGQWTAQTPNCEVIICEKLVQPEQGTINCSHPIGFFSYSSTCEFSCADGFLLNGSDWLRCQSTGQWSAQNPICKAIKCQDLINLEQVSMDCSNPIEEFSYNSTCYFSCIDGFMLNGSNRLQCQANGQWTAQIPNCEAINCRMLTEPVKGVMNCSHPIRDFSYRSTCDFSCSKGFILNGSDQLQCQATGQWTAPSPNCKAINCPALLNLDQGSMNCSHPIDKFSYNSTCDFSCTDGFILRGSNRLQCRANGQWTAEMPACKAVKCNGLRVPKHGTMNCTHPVGDYNYLSVCVFGCVEGFILKGMDVIRCTDSGKWTNELPHCEVVKCQELNTNLPVIMNCSHPLGNFSYNSVCDFDCMEGFVLETPARLQCNKSGQWTEDIPLCNGFGFERSTHTNDILLYVGAIGGAAVFGLIIAMTVIWIRRKLKSQEDDSKMLTSNSVEIAQDTFENPAFVNNSAG